MPPRLRDIRGDAVDRTSKSIRLAVGPFEVQHAKYVQLKENNGCIGVHLAPIRSTGRPDDVWTEELLSDIFGHPLRMVGDDKGRSFMILP